MNNLVADPLFVARGLDDYRLQPSSPALSVADPSFVQPTDYDGVARPQGGAPDAGAYES